MTEAEAFKKLVEAYGFKFIEHDDQSSEQFDRHRHYVRIPMQHSKDEQTDCALKGQDYAASLNRDFHINLFGDKSNYILSFNDALRRGLGRVLCSECAHKFSQMLFDYKTLDELDIMLTLAGANRK